jgi:hypothetical protein
LVLDGFRDNSRVRARVARSMAFSKLPRPMARKINQEVITLVSRRARRVFLRIRREVKRRVRAKREKKIMRMMGELGGKK